MVTMTNDLEKKYNIIYIDNRHVYQLNISNYLFITEKSSPYLIILNNQYYKVTSWKRLLEIFMNKLILDFKIPTFSPLKIKNSWTKQKVFSINNVFGVNHIMVENDGFSLYMNTNFTSRHLMFIIVDLMKYYQIPSETLKIYYTKKPKYESEEVRNYFYSKTIDKIREYLLITKGFSNHRIESYFVGMKKVDKLFRRHFENYYSLFLFEDKHIFSTMKSKFYRKVILKMDNVKNIKTIKYLLDLLTDFYGYYN